jgi:hypothetical protein
MCVSEVTSNKDQYYVRDAHLGSHSIVSNTQKGSVYLSQSIWVTVSPLQRTACYSRVQVPRYVIHSPAQLNFSPR